MGTCGRGRPEPGAVPRGGGEPAGGRRAGSRIRNRRATTACSPPASNETEPLVGVSRSTAARLYRTRPPADTVGLRRQVASTPACTPNPVPLPLPTVACEKVAVSYG